MIKLKMIPDIFRNKNRKSVVVCAIAENSFKVLKFLTTNNKKSLVSLDLEAISPDEDEKGFSAKIVDFLRKAEYRNSPLIFSLPRNSATCRYLKVPTDSSEELEKIVALQASRHLPYPASELITAYQKILLDKDGYSHVNVVIVHKEVINRYLNIFQELRISTPSIVLSSFGVGSFFNYISPQDSGIAMLVDIDVPNIEVAVTARQKVLFSRYFKLDRSQPDWRSVFVDEIIKSQDAYLKEVQGGPITKVVILGKDNFRQEFAQTLREQAQFAVESLSLDKKIDMPENIRNKLTGIEASFFNLLGLGLGTQEDSLILLPLELKGEARRRVYNRRHLKTVLWLAIIIILWAITTAKNLDNKARYLALLKGEVNKLAKEARPLEDAEKRFKILENRNAKQVLILDMLQELYRILPQAISLNTLSYDENNQIILRGQTAELNSVFSFVAQLEGSAAFKRYNIKVRYATKKKIQTGEIVDFEIVCLKR